MSLEKYSTKELRKKMIHHKSRASALVRAKKKNDSIMDDIAVELLAREVRDGKQSEQNGRAQL